MKNIKAFQSVSRGEKHREKNSPCQDAALISENSENGIYIAAVSDGHGSEPHFRSEIGSSFAVDIAVRLIKEFLENPESLQLAVPYASSGVIALNETDQNDVVGNRKQSERDRLMKGLIASIISNWNTAVGNHWNENIPSIEELELMNVPRTLKDGYLSNINLETAYGCTLIAYASTPDFCVAFQIGDGTCITFDDKANSFMPIPEDKRYIGSMTASLCNDDAINSFRYCYDKSNKSVAVFLATDGLDGVYGQMLDFSIPKLIRFYASILKLVKVKGFEDTLKEIETALPELSKKGVTRDDMSLAGILNLDEIKTIHSILIHTELKEAEKELINKAEQLNKLETKLINVKDDSKNFEMKSVQSELEVVKKEREKLIIKIEELKSDL